VRYLYGSKDQTNSIKVLKEKDATKVNPEKQHKIQQYNKDTQIQKKHKKSPSLQ